MTNMKSLIGLLLTISLFFAQNAEAVPIFHVYIAAASPETMEPDGIIWTTTASEFDLILSGECEPWSKSLEEITLLISVPKGETEIIFIAGPDAAHLLNQTNPITDDCFNPHLDAVIDLLLNQTGNDGYSHKNYLPKGVKFGNHYPFKEDVSNFLLFVLRGFRKTPNAVSNFSTEDKVYSNLVRGFASPHLVSVRISERR